MEANGCKAVDRVSSQWHMAAASLVDYSSRGRGCLGTAIIVMMVTVYSTLRAQTRQLQVVGEGKGVTFKPSVRKHKEY